MDQHKDLNLGFLRGHRALTHSLPVAALLAGAFLITNFRGARFKAPWLPFRGVGEEP
jgi:membrane-bound metal-dependent hydrolase YbcI (DUF457 family)